MYGLLRKGGVKDINVYNAFLEGITRKGYDAEATKLLNEMSKVGPKPNHFTYIFFISMYLKKAMDQKALEFYNDMVANPAIETRISFQHIKDYFYAKGFDWFIPIFERGITRVYDYEIERIAPVGVNTSAGWNGTPTQLNLIYRINGVEHTEDIIALFRSKVNHKLVYERYQILCDTKPDYLECNDFGRIIPQFLEKWLAHVKELDEKRMAQPPKPQEPIVEIKAEDVPNADKIVSDDAGIMELDTTNGDNTWTRLIGSTAYDEGRGITVYNNTVYVAGFTEGFFDNNQFTGTQDIFLIAYNNNGTKLWSSLYGTNCQSYGITNDIYGNIFVAGYTVDQFLNNPKIGTVDAILFKVNPQLSTAVIFTNSVGNATWNSVITDERNGIAVTGSSTTFNYYLQSYQTN